MAEILHAYSRYGNTLLAARRTLEAALAGGRQIEQRSDIKQRSLLVRFSRRDVEQIVADHLDRRLYLHGDRQEVRCGTENSRQIRPAGQAPARKDYRIAPKR